MLRLFNTSSRSKEDFVPLQPGRAGIYTCGPTVYGSPHIGNLRAYIFADVLRRTLALLGYSVTQVVNVTDVGHLTTDGDAGEDKLEKGARSSGRTVWQVAQDYEAEFVAALAALQICPPSHLPRATEHIADQLTLIRALTARGFTYETSDGIYFDTSRFASYGRLSGQALEEKAAGARVAVKDEKRNPTDFALWKFCVGENAQHVMRWDFETGADLSRDSSAGTSYRVGFPGWHIECSAMSLRYLAPELLSDLDLPHGDRTLPAIDIHTGGVDHIPVHHENEIAQSEAALGRPFVRYWLHNEFLTVDGGKMSKSLGNLFTLADLAKRDLSPLAFRLLCLGAHYRTRLNFTWEALQSNHQLLLKIQRAFLAWPESTTAKPDSSACEKFTAALADDLNTPQALAVLHEVWHAEALDPAVRKATWLYFDQVLGLGLRELPAVTAVDLPPAVAELIRLREQARAQRDWVRADTLRAELLAAGYSVTDTAEGQKWEKI